MQWRCSGRRNSNGDLLTGHEGLHRTAHDLQIVGHQHHYENVAACLRVN